MADVPDREKSLPVDCKSYEVRRKIIWWIGGAVIAAAFGLYALIRAMPLIGFLLLAAGGFLIWIIVRFRKTPYLLIDGKGITANGLWRSRLIPADRVLGCRIVSGPSTPKQRGSRRLVVTHTAEGKAQPVRTSWDLNDTDCLPGEESGLIFVIEKFCGANMADLPDPDAPAANPAGPADPRAKA